MKTPSQNLGSRLKSRPEQASTTRPGQINSARRQINRSLDTESLLTLLQREAPHFFDRAEVVGRWVWIQFYEKQPAAITRALAELGFHWNPSRQTWQHPCGVWCDKAAPADPRDKYGSFFAAGTQPVQGAHL